MNYNSDNNTENLNFKESIKILMVSQQESETEEKQSETLEGGSSKCEGAGVPGSMDRKLYPPSTMMPAYFMDIPQYFNDLSMNGLDSTEICEGPTDIAPESELPSARTREPFSVHPKDRDQQPPQEYDGALHTHEFGTGTTLPSITVEMMNNVSEVVSIVVSEGSEPVMDENHVVMRREGMISRRAKIIIVAINMIAIAMIILSITITSMLKSHLSPQQSQISTASVTISPTPSYPSLSPYFHTGVPTFHDEINELITTYITSISDTSRPSQNKSLHFILHDDPAGLTTSSPNLFQRYFLMLLFYSMNGENWEYYHGFGTGENECNWEGVGCFQNGSMSEIVLRSNSIMGSIPSEIGMMYSIQKIDFTNNEIFGTLPNEIEHLENLNILKLGNNLLTGTFPKALTYLVELEVIYLNGNDFSGTLPESLNNMSKAMAINFSNNRFNGTIPEFTAFPKLEAWLLNNNKITGTVPSSIGKLQSMYNFHMDSNYITGTLPTEIGQLENLQQLFMHKNDIVGNVPNDGEVCALRMTHFWMDCRGVFPEVVCDCCSYCCSDGLTCHYYRE